MSALCWSNSSATSLLLRSAAKWRGVPFSSSLASMSALHWSNSSVTSVLLPPAALWRGVLLFLSLASMSALFWSNKLATSVLLPHEALWRGVPLLLSLASMSALCWNNSSATSKLSCRAASWRGVLFFLSLTSMSALRWSNRLATSVLLYVATMWRGVRLNLRAPWTFGETPSDKSCSTFSKSPFFTAWHRSSPCFSKHKREDNKSIKTGQIWALIKIFVFLFCKTCFSLKINWMPSIISNLIKPLIIATPPNIQWKRKEWMWSLPILRWKHLNHPNKYVIVKLVSFWWSCKENAIPSK